jgi:ribonuclease P protein component
MNDCLSLSKPPIERLSEGGSFPKSARVRYRREFLKIQRHGFRVHTNFFTVVVLKDVSCIQPRMGCAVSKRVGNSVVRSRVRRLIRESFRRRQDCLSAVDFVVIAKPQAAQCARDGLKAVSEDLVPALFKANALALRKHQEK